MSKGVGDYIFIDLTFVDFTVPLYIFGYIFSSVVCKNNQNNKAKQSKTKAYENKAAAR